MTAREFFEYYRYELVLAAILLISLFLNVWILWNLGISNEYYAAAVKSMLENPGVMFFNSFDSGGFVTVDKPPVGLWVQVVSVAVLGFSGWALVLPQALAGVGSAALLYLIVSRPFGKPAGLLSALALAITPIFVAVSRNGTIDGLLIFVLLLALFAALKAAREQSPVWLGISVILIGIGFNIKMIQAFIVVPAVLVIYLIGARKLPVKTRALHMIMAVLVLVIVSLSWTVAVDLVPADQRPYIGGSGDNTVLGLIINYNGIHRLENGMGGPGAGPGGSLSSGSGMGVPQDSSFSPGMLEGNRTPNRGMGMASAVGTGPRGSGAMPAPGDAPSGAFGSGTPPGRTGGDGGMMDETGSPGPLRLLTEGLAAQITWLIPLALIGLLALWRRPAEFSPAGLEEAGLFSERGLTVLAFALWLAPGLLYFSFTTGFWHTYYLATIAPPIAALAGIGTFAMVRAYLGEGGCGWILPGAVLVTGIIQVWILRYQADWAGPLVPALAVLTIAFTVILAYARPRKAGGGSVIPKAAACAAIGLLLVSPFVWSCTPMAYGSGNILPTAGPQTGRGGMGTPQGSGPSAQGGTGQLASWLVAHSSGETWIVAVPSSHEAASIIIETGKPVMALGGFSGSDSILSVQALTTLVNSGKIRYFYTPSATNGTPGGAGGQSGNTAIYSWVSSHCTAVPASEYGSSGSDLPRASGFPGMPGTSTSDNRTGTTGMPGLSAGGPQNSWSTLYDCAGAV